MAKEKSNKSATAAGNVIVGNRSKDATPLEAVHWAIDKFGLPAALKQMTEAELQECWWMYRLTVARKYKQEEVRACAKRLKAAKKLRSLLPYPLPDLDDIIAIDEWLLNPKDTPPSVGWRARHASWQSLMAARPRERLSEEVKKLSPFENVVGLLARIFEEHCGYRAGYTRDAVNDRTHGEFLRFAICVLAALGITRPGGAPYKYRSIEAALIKCRRLRNQ